MTGAELAELYRTGGPIRTNHMDPFRPGMRESVWDTLAFELGNGRFATWQDFKARARDLCGGFVRQETAFHNCWRAYRAATGAGLQPPPLRAPAIQMTGEQLYTLWLKVPHTSTPRAWQNLTANVKASWDDIAVVCTGSPQRMRPEPRYFTYQFNACRHRFDLREIEAVKLKQLWELWREQYFPFVVLKYTGGERLQLLEYGIVGTVIEVRSDACRLAFNEVIETDWVSFEALAKMVDAYQGEERDEPEQVRVNDSVFNARDVRPAEHIEYNSTSSRFEFRPAPTPSALDRAYNEAITSPGRVAGQGRFGSNS